MVRFHFEKVTDYSVETDAERQGRKLQEVKDRMT